MFGALLSLICWMLARIATSVICCTDQLGNPYPFRFVSSLQCIQYCRHQCLGFLRVVKFLGSIVTVPYIPLGLCYYILKFRMRAVVNPVLLGVLICAQWASDIVFFGAFSLTFIATVPVFVMQYSGDKCCLTYR